LQHIDETLVRRDARPARGVGIRHLLQIRPRRHELQRHRAPISFFSGCMILQPSRHIASGILCRAGQPTLPQSRALGLLQQFIGHFRTAIGETVEGIPAVYFNICSCEA